MLKIEIYTEDRDNLALLASRFFDSFTLSHNEGYYKGIPEKSAKIEIICDNTLNTNMGKAISLAETIRLENGQAEVWITSHLINLRNTRRKIVSHKNIGTNN